MRIVKDGYYLLIIKKQVHFWCEIEKGTYNDPNELRENKNLIYNCPSCREKKSKVSDKYLIYFHIIKRKKKKALKVQKKLEESPIDRG